jgi:hypothetical protein
MPIGYCTETILTNKFKYVYIGLVHYIPLLQQLHSDSRPDLLAVRRPIGLGIYVVKAKLKTDKIIFH